MDSPDPNFRIVGMTSIVWAQFTSFFALRQLKNPPYSPDGVFVADDADLIAGCLIYPCDGPYAVVEYAATNPRFSPRLAHNAMLHGACALPLYGAMRGKVMLCFPRSRGMAKLLERAGFAYEKTPVMVPRMQLPPTT